MEQTQSATAQVLASVELLEGILRHLPIQDLLHAPAVCWTWRNTIERCKVLQEALYFRPIEPTSDNEERKINPLLYGKFKGLFRLHKYFGREEWDTFLPGSGAALDAILRPETSWRRMYLTQPPPRHLWIRFGQFPIQGVLCSAITLILPSNDGLRMGPLYCLMFDCYSSEKYRESVIKLYREHNSLSCQECTAYADSWRAEREPDEFCFAACDAMIELEYNTEHCNDSDDDEPWPAYREQKLEEVRLRQRFRPVSAPDDDAMNRLRQIAGEALHGANLKYVVLRREADAAEHKGLIRVPSN